MEPERRVHELVREYEAVEILHPVISKILETPQRAIFEKSLEQELKLISSRSSLLEDHEVSIVQKAFMILMDSPEHRVGAVELYVQEIIGLKLIVAKEKDMAFQTAVNARNLFLKDSTPDEPLERKLYDIDHSRVEEERPFPFPGIVTENPKAQNSPASVSKPQEGLESVTSPAQTFDPDADPHFKRLWELFKIAREEFRSQSMDNNQMAKAARFLRDTSENVMDFVRAKQPSAMAINDTSGHEPQGLAQKLFELRSSLDQAIEVAETTCGGRKRRFEYAITDVPDKSQTQGSSQENVRQSEATVRPIHSKRQRVPHAHDRGQREVLPGGKSPRTTGLQGIHREFRTSTGRPRRSDKYRPSYN